MLDWVLSLGQDAAVNDHGMPEHETCARTAQPQDGGSDLFRFAEATNWFGRHEGFDDTLVAIGVLP